MPDATKNPMLSYSFIKLFVPQLNGSSIKDVLDKDDKIKKIEKAENTSKKEFDPTALLNLIANGKDRQKL